MGSTAEVGWVSVANHAGGYSWSLCRAGQPLTEDCFDQVPLQFVTNTSKLRYMFLEEDGSIGPNRTEVTIPAHRVTEGVLPKNSMWSKNPVGLAPSVGLICPLTVQLPAGACRCL